MFCKVDNLVMYLIVTCDDETTVRAAQRVAHQKGLHTTVKMILGAIGVNVVMST